jgi:hypothetical protein
VRQAAILLISTFVLSSCRAASNQRAALPTGAGASPGLQATPSVTAAASSDDLIGLAPDQFAAVVTDDLIVRSAPGTGQDSTIFPGRLSAPLSVYIIDGPVASSGYAWYLVVPVYGSQLDVPPPGWVAAAGRDGEAWLRTEPKTVQCKELPPQLDELIALEPQLWVGCYRGEELMLEGVLGDCAPSGATWAGSSDTRCLLYRPGYQVDAIPTLCLDDCSERFLSVHIDRDLPTTQRGAIVRFSGHFDDPAAGNCTPAPGDEGYSLPRLAVFECRMQFVATSMSLVSPA